MVTASWPGMPEWGLMMQFMARLAPRLDFAILCAAGMLVPSLNFAGKTREAQRQSRVRALPPSLAGNECRAATPQRHLPRRLISQRINKSTMAPIVAEMIAAMMPRPR
jgi:hypothetical protein